MARAYINDLSDDLLIRIFWSCKEPYIPRQPINNNVDTTLFGLPGPRYSCENPYGEELTTSDDYLLPLSLRRNDNSSSTTVATCSNSPLSAPSALTDPAYNLLIASVCSRWRRLARRQVSMLVVKKNRVVPLADLIAAVACFPHLSHVHLSDNSAETIDDAFLAHLAASCPKLVSLHVGKGMTKQWCRVGGDGFPVTAAGVDRFVRRCTQLQHLSLYCLHPYEYLPPSLANLAHLRTLGLTHAVPLQVPGFTRLTSLTALALDIPEDADLDFATLARLPAFATLSLSNATRNQRGSIDELPFSLAQVPSLRALEFDPCSPPFDSLFPPGLSFSNLERLLLKGCEGLERLPDDMGERLPRLRDLSICACKKLSELPEQLTALSCLETLTISSCSLVTLPESFGWLPALKTLTLSHVRISGLPASFHQLTSLETFNLLHSTSFRFPAAFGDLTALQCLYILKGPYSMLPNDVGGLARLKELALAKLPHLPQVLKSLPHSLDILSLGTYQRLTPFLEVPALPRLRRLSLISVGCMRGLVPGMALPSVEHVELSLVGEAEDLPLPLDLFPNLRTLKIATAGRLKSFPKKYVSVLQRLQRIHINQAVKLRELTESVTALHRLTSIEIHAPEFSSLPDGIGALSRLRRLNLANCSALAELPASLTQLSCLHDLNLRCTSLHSLPRHFGRLRRLKTLDLHGCKQLAALPRDISQLKMLHSLTITGCADDLDTECLDNMRGLRIAKTFYDYSE
ncbi:unnamed protein product [Closterium sp. Naga37s-1]|nr:unnamed protein product [Closterium sp. Naga37s-1]